MADTVVIITTIMSTGRSSAPCSVDIHTHILPGIDDGAQNIEQSKQLIALQIQNGVSRIFLTPHFDCRAITVSAFIEVRQSAFEQLIGAYPDGSPAAFKLGAEVHYHPGLFDLDFRKLTLGDSDYLLLELPFDYYPAHIKKLVSAMQIKGIIPVLAHVERYPYFRQKPELLLDLIQQGVLGQVNATSLLNAVDKGFGEACLLHGLAQMIATDSHNAKTRFPCMAAAMDLFSKDSCVYFAQFTEAIWDNEDVPYFTPSVVRKRFGKYI